MKKLKQEYPVLLDYMRQQGYGRPLLAEFK